MPTAPIEAANGANALDPDARARILWDYLRLGIPVRPAECLLVLGGHDIGVAHRAADLYAGGIAPLIVVSGGSRAVPDGSDSPTEADAIAGVLLNRGVPREAIALERLASNTSENFWLAAERRTIATARRRWPRKHVTVTSQQASLDEYLTGNIPADILDAARDLQAAGFNRPRPLLNSRRAGISSQGRLPRSPSGGLVRD